VAGEPYRLGAINVVTLRDGRIAELAGFLDPPSAVASPCRKSLPDRHDEYPM